MKKIFTLFSAIFIALFVSAQSPDKMTYQAVVRDGSDNLVVNSPVGMQISILQGSSTGPSVYVETFTATSNANGLVTVEIGTGSVVSGSIVAIDWSAGPYFLLTETDPAGGTSYSISGTSEFLSVPYALYAKSADYNELSNLPTLIDMDSTNELNNSLVLNGTILELTDAGGMLTADLSALSGGGSSNWTLSGTHIYSNNSGNVGIGITSPKHKLSVGDTGIATFAVGHSGNFNETESGRLVFSEDVNFVGDCGLMFHLNGALNNLYLSGGCTTFGDTLARFNRSGFSNIRQLTVGNLTGNTSLATPLAVEGNVTITGNLSVTGNISKGGGTFKIDHPLDPENKYLVHSFVESPEMMNVYSGNITSDVNGFATVNLPAYFETANKDFRYQLTVIGTFEQAIIKEKISGNQFVIQTSAPGVEVSWQVTGVRADRYANEHRVNPEEEKELKGSYLHPELYGFGKEKAETQMREKTASGKKSTEKGADGQ